MRENHFREVTLGIKTTLKQVRASQPLNNVATSALRRLCGVAGRPSEFLIKHLPRTGITSVTLPNGRTLKLEAAGEEWTSTQLFWRGWQGYEPEVVTLFYRLAESAQTVFDAGAHIGFYSVLASLANPSGQVFAFEPLPTVFERLEHNVKLNGLSNVRCFRLAVGSKDGTQDFYFPDEEQPISSSLRSEMLAATFPENAIHHVPVLVVTLDQFVVSNEIARVDLIKLDTERTEHDVIAGASETLARYKPEIFCEVWPDAGNQRQLESSLSPLGYRFFHLLPEGPAERAEIIGSETALNYLFTTRPEALNL